MVQEDETPWRRMGTLARTSAHRTDANGIHMALFAGIGGGVNGRYPLLRRFGAEL
ncbi:MAG: hypothetical protein QHG99_08570 [Methanomicrobiales archaeon]|nr:hypothetical protein [Methanomicrobiales archaeon]